MLHNLPPQAIVFFVSTLPWIELRLAIPIGVAYNLDIFQIFVFAIFGNIVPVPIILLFLNNIEKFLRTYTFWNDFFDKLFEKTYKRANKKIIKYEFLGLLFFVSIPLPFTGAWTASLIAYLFKLNFLKSILTIFIGIIIAGVIVTIITVYVKIAIS